jgi:ubiquinone/menaquinone biosynthesis C-methylase UbiE
MEPKAHWDNLYSALHPEKLGWYEPHLRVSLDMISAARIDREARIIDIGGGASTLVDDLLARGFEHITVLDLSQAALSLARARLGEQAGKVWWLAADITSASLPPNHFDLWHDRAVFHFLKNGVDRENYIKTMRRSVTAHGHIVIGTFSLQAPPKCSGLEVQRYSLELLHRELGEDLELREHKYDAHMTPGGVEQTYVYCRFQKPT